MKHHNQTKPSPSGPIVLPFGVLACFSALLIVFLTMLPGKSLADLGTKGLKPEQLGAMFTRVCRDTGLKQKEYRDQMAFYGFVEGAEEAYTNGIHSIMFRLSDYREKRFCQMFYASGAYSAEDLTRAIAFAVFEGRQKIEDHIFKQRFRRSDASFNWSLNPFSKQHFAHKVYEARGGQTWYLAVVSQPVDLGNSLKP